MNRFTRSIVFASLAALLVLTGGCDLTSLNDNPNQPTEAAPPKLLTNAQINIAEETWQDYAGGFWVRYAQYWTTNQYTDADRFAYAQSRPGALDNLWEDLYLALNDLQQIKRINRSRPDRASAFGPNNNQIAIANIMQVWTLSFMTDIWGPIPVANALKGAESGNFAPEYNSGPEVYDAMVDSLTSASDNIDPSTAALSGGDLVYSGDASQWKKFANSLKLRIAMRASGKGGGNFPAGLGQVSEAGGSTQEVVNTWIGEALDAGVFESGDESALLPFTSSAPYQNPFYENREVDNRSDWAAPEGIVGVMNDLNDPRRSAYFTSVDGGEYVGFPYGLPQSQAQSRFASGSFSIPSERVASTPDAPNIMMLYDEVEFIKAEILLRDDLNNHNLSGTAQSHFETALRASLDYWGVTSTSEKDDYVNAVGPVTTQNFQQKLGTQKWLAQYLQGVQGWSTWRRLDFTGVLQIPSGDPGQERFGKSIAVRMTYPNDEFTLNNDNVTAAIENLLGGSGAGDDNQGVLLWWDTEYPDAAY